MEHGARLDSPSLSNADADILLLISDNGVLWCDDQKPKGSRDVWHYVQHAAVEHCTANNLWHT